MLKEYIHGNSLLRCLAMTCCCIAILSFAFPFRCSAQQVILKPSDGITRDVTLNDMYKYVQTDIGITQQIWSAFTDIQPKYAGEIADALTVLTMSETLSDSTDPLATYKVLKIIVETGIGKTLDKLQEAGYMPLGTIVTIFGLYKDSLEFFRDRIFTPGMVNLWYDVYKKRRLEAAGYRHDDAWDPIEPKISPFLVNEIAVNVILKKRGVDAGVFEGVSFDDEAMKRARRTVKGSAANRSITVIYDPSMTFHGSPYIMNKDISDHIELFIGFDVGWQEHLLGVRNRITRTDMVLRGLAEDHRKMKEEYRDINGKDYSSYPPLSASQDVALEKELKRLFAEIEAANIGPEIRDEALQHIAMTLKLRFEKEMAEQALRQRRAAAQRLLDQSVQELASFAWVRLITVRVMDEDGQPGETIPSAAMFVDGTLCTTQTNGGKPCATNRIGMAALHLSKGGHDVEARAPGFKPATIRIFSQESGSPNPPPDEHTILLEPDAPVDLAVTFTSGEYGNPLAGAQLTLYLPKGKTSTLTTDDQGQVVFPAIIPGSRLILRAKAPYHARGEWRDIAASDGPLNLFLEPFRTTVTVQAMGLDGQPLPSARITLGEVSHVANQQGLAVFENMPPPPEGKYTLTGEASGLPAVQETLNMTPAKDGETLRTTLSFKVKTAIMAVVRDNQNRIVPGAKVIIDSPNGSTTHAADGNGYVRLSNLALGGHYLHAEAAGYQSGEDIEIILTPQKPTGQARLVLTSGMTLKVLVVDGEGNAIPAKISMDGGPQTNAPTGSASFDAVKPGKHVFLADTDTGQISAEYTADPKTKTKDTLLLRLLPAAARITVTVTGTGVSANNTTIALIRNKVSYQSAKGNRYTFDNLPEGVYQAQSYASDGSKKWSGKVTIPTGSTQTYTLTLDVTPEEPEEPTGPGKIEYLEAKNIAGNEYQYTHVGIRRSDHSFIQLSFDKKTAPSVRATFCQTVGGTPAPTQHEPSVGFTGGKTANLAGQVVCDTSKNPDGKACLVFMTITCTKGCTPGDPSCDPDAKATPDQTQNAPPPAGKWSFSSYGKEGPNQSYRFVRLNGEAVSADAGNANAFCRSQGLPAVHPQPSGNTTNWGGITVNASGVAVCKTKSQGGSDSVCPSYRDITCKAPPPAGAGAPCNPNDPLCGMDMDVQ